MFSKYHGRKRTIQFVVTFIALGVLLLLALVHEFDQRQHDNAASHLQHHRHLTPSNDRSHYLHLAKEHYTDEQINRLARPFRPIFPRPTSTTPNDKKTTPPWCVRPSKYDPSTPSGLLYVKVPKTASSTLSGITARIAQRHGPSATEPCMAQFEHFLGNQYNDRLTARSFLWGSVRNPTDRALSHVFFDFVTRKDMPPTDDRIIEKLKTYTSYGQGGFQLTWLTGRDPSDMAYGIWDYRDFKKVKDPTLAATYVTEIMDKYDFLAVAERVDESLVALQLLLGLHPGDILYISSKVAGGFDDGWTGHCYKIKPARRTDYVENYFHAYEWFVRNSVDFLIHAVADRSLDMTIESLGRKRFESELARHRRLQEMVHEKCASEAKFPCEKNGVLNRSAANCYWNDSGCGYACIDRLLKTGELESVLSE